MSQESLGGVFVTGTDTEVGKTFVSALLLKILLEQGVRATYFKPVATGCTLKGTTLVAEDLEVVREISGAALIAPLHCPLKFLKPLAPLAASRLEGKALEVSTMRSAFEELREGSSFIVAEGVGGLLVPLTENYTLLDFVEETRLPALVVARPGLGTINHTLLTLGALKAREIPVLGFVTNGHKKKEDEAAATSPGIIEEFSHVPFLGHIPLYEQGIQDLDSFIDNEIPFLKQLCFNLVPSTSGSILM